MIIKVCGMRDADNIRAIDELGCVDWMGFIFYPPSSRNVEQVPEYLPKHCKRVGVFVNATVKDIQQRQKECGLHLIQLHGNESSDYCQELRSTMDEEVKIIKMIQIASPQDLENASQYEGKVDYFLFETKCQGYGGSGKQFDWEILKAYNGSTPFLLTGGIGPDDAERIRTLNSQLSTLNFIGIDLNSRFETAPALKNVQRIKAFVQTIK
ncbi:MAG: phosphoribosylanthranilate isomerase [Bacteroidaceae bacterium]|nr:phosphoribosylanthranilate isomerase [Bacteroidaceae bacterium]